MNIHLYLLSMRVRDENKELAIREKAVQIIVEDGLDGLSMQKLAKAAGVSPATIYIYYKQKDDLILQLCIGEFNAMAEATLKGFDPQMNFAEGLKVQWVNRARYYLKNPVTLDFMEQMRHTRYYKKMFKLLDRRFFEAMGTFVHTAIKRKQLTPLPLEAYWYVAFAPLYQLIKFHTSGIGMGGTGKKFVFNNRIMTQTFELVIKALTP
jgi:AcrR family transcriptional regulator